MRKFLLNCDLGEGIGNDELLMPYIQLCNIACGGHFGDYNSVKETVIIAKKYQVKIGAHPSYPDIINFGRKTMQISELEFNDSILAQIELVSHVLIEENEELFHIKPHGALYNDLMVNKELSLWAWTKDSKNTPISSKNISARSRTWA